MPVSFPQYDSNNPEQSFNTLVRLLEQTFDDFQEGNYRGIAGTQLKENTVRRDNLTADVVGTNELEDESVIHVKIGTSAVWGDKIGVEAVSGGHIIASAVSAGHLDANAVTTTKINNGAVTGPKIGVSAVSAGHLDSNSVITTKINNGAVTGPKIAVSAVSVGHLDFPVVQQGRYLIGPYTYAWPGSSLTNQTTFFSAWREAGGFGGDLFGAEPFATLRACRVSGLVIRTELARTAGSLTVNVVGSTAGTLGIQGVVNAANPNGLQVLQSSGDNLAANEKVSVVFTTNGAWAPTTNNNLLVWVELTDI